MFGWSGGYFLEENLFMPGFKGKHPPTDLLSAGFYPCLIIGASGERFSFISNNRDEIVTSRFTTRSPWPSKLFDDVGQA